MCNFTMLNYVFEVHCHSAFRFHFTVTSHITHYVPTDIASGLQALKENYPYIHVLYRIKIEFASLDLIFPYPQF